MDAPHFSLSKSLFIKGLQCIKALYLDRYHPELKDRVTEAQQRIFDSGTQVGLIARDHLPGGVEIPYDGFTLQEQIEKTAAAIKQGATTIYEAAFEHEGLFMKADILSRDSRGWNLYEVKSATQVKDVHIDDLAFQYYVLTAAGIHPASASLVHLNNLYVRNGAIDVRGLFVIEDLTGLVKDRHTAVAYKIERLREALSGDAPDIDIGIHCDDPYPCDFRGHCWQHIPEDSVFDLKQRGARPFDLYSQGIILLKNVPLHLVSGSQLMQLEAFLNRKEYVDLREVKNFLDTLWYPLYFLDFETFMPAIPPYNGLRPYQQVPFQYSLHYIEREGADLGHHEFLAEANADPRLQLANKLVDQIPEDACIVAYNAGFEAGRIRELADFFPQYRMRLLRIINNLRDLMIPFRKGHIYHWQMKGSYSQKAVLPVLVPDLCYQGMEVADGGMAMDAYARMCSCGDQDEIGRIRKALLEYCKLDTLGMVRIVGSMKEISA